MSCKPKLKVIRSHLTGSCAWVTSQRSRHATPVAASPAPPSQTSKGPCCTLALAESTLVAVGV
eukprot:4125704-Prymnesium_polylepis.1